jgi:hypothetical protein
MEFARRFRRCRKQETSRHKHVKASKAADFMHLTDEALCREPARFYLKELKA